MVPHYYIIDNSSQAELPVVLQKAEKSDYEITTLNLWQTSWQSGFIQNADLLKYAMKISDTGELVGLGAYRDVPEGIMIYVEYIESEPNSNPTLNRVKKYSGIGAALLAFGVQLSIDRGYGGAVFLKAKTTELRNHYINQFGAIPFSRIDPYLLMIDGDAARNLFFPYLKEES